MTVHIVDFLESIEVDAEDRKTFVAGGRALEGLCEVVAERSPIGQIGKWIMKARYAMRASFWVRSVMSSCVESHPAF
jgi:hypothetical protein